DVVHAEARRQLAQQEAVRVDVDPGQVGDDTAHAAEGGRWIAQPLDQLGAPASLELVADGDQTCAARRQIHRSADAAAGLPGYAPVGEVTVGRHLECAQDDRRDATGARHGERRGRVEIRGAGHRRDQLSARVVEVDVL